MPLKCTHSFLLRLVPAHWAAVAAVGGALIGITAGCGAGDGPPLAHAGAGQGDIAPPSADAARGRAIDAGTDQAAPSPPPWLPQPLWSSGEVLALAADGITPEVSIAVPDKARYLAVRAEALTAQASDPACLRLVEVQRSDGELWVGPGEAGRAGGHCLSCARPVSTQPGYTLGVFAAPSQGLQAAASLALRVQLRHCETDLPMPPGALGSQVSQVRVQWASEPEVAATALGSLDVVIALGAGAGEGRQAAWLDELKAQMSAAFAAAHLTLQFRPHLDISAASQGLGTSLDVSSPAAPGMAALQQAVDGRWQQQAQQVSSLAQHRVAVVVLWPCLSSQTPTGGGQLLAGFASRIPGGGRVGTAPSLVVVATGACGSSAAPTSARLGSVAAHELGHLLGLYHSDGPHGLANASGAKDLMHSQHAVAGDLQAGFGAAQIEVLRAHPDVKFP